ncbi:MAG: T9SS type A sorting domain-containing protein [Chitinophagaceae bacterium]|nr:MAG: T9SS type A sorting domain-containing protein [Chitinophagaceae bacterium]
MLISPIAYMSRICCVFIFSWLICATAFGQTHKAPEDSVIETFSCKWAVSQPYLIAQTTEVHPTLPAGWRVVRTLSHNVFVVKRLSVTKEVPGINLFCANDKWKLSPALLAAAENLQNKTYDFIIAADDIRFVARQLETAIEPIKLLQINDQYQTAVINCSSKFLLGTLITHSKVLYADFYIKAAAEQMIIGYNRNLQHINRLQHHFPEVNGKGITIGIKEQKMNAADLDLLKRVLPSALAAPTIEEHATVVATLAGGAGNSFFTGKGVAWQCNFYPSSFSNLFPDDAATLSQNEVWVQNHSYGTVVQHFYGAEANAYDQQTWQQRDLVHVFASGNRGQDAPAQGTYSGLAGFANLTGNFKMAKNIISVAATDTSGNIAAYSSSGPLFDGRMAPQIAALGPGGTSDAAALVSGAVALLQQVYKDSNAQMLPPSSLLKAILFTTADDIGNKGIDYRSGFGSLNVYDAVKLLRQKKYDGSSLAQGQAFTKNIIVPPGTGQLKVTLAWTDTATSLNSFKALVNDLDLEVIETGTGNVYRPWCLSTAANADSLSNLPRRRKDSLNNAEQVTIDIPAAGSYQLRVSGYRVSTQAAQPFYIAYTWDTLGSFTFTSPVNANDADRTEDPYLKITWQSVEADTNQLGKLWVSFNNGLSWKIISNTVKLSAKKYGWPLPDTASRVRLRMDNATGSFYSNEFMLAPLTRLSLGFLCTDSLQLTWNKHVDASAYKIYTLEDSAYLKLVATVADSSMIMPRLPGNNEVYAVQPVLSSGIMATRSSAIGVNNQGVNCFYKTLLGENLGTSVKLILNLSTLYSVDSVLFEKLDRFGRVQTVIGRIAINGMSQLTAFDLLPSRGVNYYRATIIKRNGQTFTTETILLLINGDQLLYLYPNPSQGNQPVRFQLNDFLPGMQLQISDATGRIIRNEAIGAAGEIATKNLPAGMYLITILKDGQRLETGKLMIGH